MERSWNILEHSTQFLYMAAVGKPNDRSILFQSGFENCSTSVPGTFRNVPTAELNHVNIRHKYLAFWLLKMIWNVLEHSCNTYGTPNCLLGMLSTQKKSNNFFFTLKICESEKKVKKTKVNKSQRELKLLILFSSSYYPSQIIGCCMKLFIIGDLIKTHTGQNICFPTTN